MALTDPQKLVIKCWLAATSSDGVVAAFDLTPAARLTMWKAFATTNAATIRAAASQVQSEADAKAALATALETL